MKYHLSELFIVRLPWEPPSPGHEVFTTHDEALEAAKAMTVNAGSYVAEPLDEAVADAIRLAVRDSHSDFG